MIIQCHNTFGIGHFLGAEWEMEERSTHNTLREEVETPEANSVLNVRPIKETIKRELLVL